MDRPRALPRYIPVHPLTGKPHPFLDPYMFEEWGDLELSKPEVCFQCRKPASRYVKANSLGPTRMKPACGDHG